MGVQKAGTSWWYRLIASHPQVVGFPGGHKELHFFKDAWQGGLTAADVDAYHQWFARPPGAIAGEWTPDYMARWWVPAQIAQAAPRARLLVMLRDPVERFRSGLAHQLARGWAIDQAMVADAAWHGHYATQLEALLDHFPHEQILVLQYERCVDDPETHLKKTYAFLGLEYATPDIGFDREINATREAKPALSRSVQESLLETYLPEIRRLAAIAPEIDVALWHHFKDRI